MQEIQKKVGATMLESVMRGKMPDEKALLDQADKIRLTKGLLAAKVCLSFVAKKSIPLCPHFIYYHVTWNAPPSALTCLC